MKSLNIRSKTMLATHHSWSVTMRSLLTEMIKMGHNMHLISTNGTSLIPKEWEDMMDKEHFSPDIDLCYTLPQNFKTRFQKKSKVKMAIYNYESSKMPKRWLKEMKHVDYILPSSNFTKDVFVSNGWPEEKCIVVPHGINPSDFEDERTVKLRTDRSFRFLNVSIPHYRKNIDLLVDAYYASFSGDDDVCLVIKSNIAKPSKPFEVDISEQIRTMIEKHKGKVGGLPMIEIVQDRLDSIVPLYNSCNVLVSAASSEGFGLPLLEGLAAGMLVVAPGATGQVDFLNEGNSILIEVDEVEAPPEYQYIKASEGATTFKPRVDELADGMLRSYEEYGKLKRELRPGAIKTAEEFTWENAAKKIVDLA